MSKPQLTPGFLGAQPRFNEMKMKLKNQERAEFSLSGEAATKIVLKTEIPVKVVTKLTKCDTDTELPQYVMVQRDDDEVKFYVAFPGDGYYKFQIFALNESDQSESLPNIYNYLIEVKNARPAYEYIKQYTIAYTTKCHLKKPKFINPHDKLEKLHFEILVPGAKKVAVHCVEEWFHFERKNGDKFEGDVDLAKYMDQAPKFQLLANYSDTDNKYSVVAEHQLK